MAARRIALCHEWSTVYGGSEQVASRLADLLDVDDVFTFAADPDLASRLFPGRRVHVSGIGATPFARRHWRWMLPVMPRAWSAFDLSDYDVVVTSSHACVNSIRTRPDAVHISYCHTPMRYAWDWRMELHRIPRPLRPLWPALAAALRRSDRARAARVTAFIANSHYVASRIRSSYGRDAQVVTPPIDTDFWTPDPQATKGDFFLFVGRLVAYKRPELAIEAAERAGATLVVAGDGPELARLRRLAGATTSFVVAPTKEEVRDLYRRSRALVNPGVEDFGMTMAEAQACGTPIIAFAIGGAQEIVQPGRTGILYTDPSAGELGRVFRSFDPDAFDAGEIRRSAERFSLARFDDGIRKALGALSRTQAAGGSLAAREAS